MILSYSIYFLSIPPLASCPSKAVILFHIQMWTGRMNQSEISILKSQTKAAELFGSHIMTFLSLFSVISFLESEYHSSKLTGSHGYFKITKHSDDCCFLYSF